mgnify:FL=1
MEKKKKVVVAFSGGLDTSFTVMYLAKEKGYEVYAACANTGGFSPEQLKTNEENAYKLGAKEYVTIDVTQEYYEKSLRYMVFGNVLRNGTYPISVSSERIFQHWPLHAMPTKSAPMPSLMVLRVRVTTRFAST